MSLFKRVNRNFKGQVRQRETSPEAVEVKQESIAVSSKPIVNDRSATAAVSKVSKSTLSLSFGDDVEEGSDVFRIKRSTESQRIVQKLKKKAKIEKAVEEELSSLHGGPSNFEKEISVTTVSKGPTKSKVSVTTVKSESRVLESSEDEEDGAGGKPTLQVSQERLKELRNEFLVLNGDDAEVVDELNAEDDDERFGVASLLKKGVIPDATLIHQAKKQRELAKLQLDQHQEMDDPPASSERGGRHLHESDSEDDTERRINFVGSKGKDTDRELIRSHFLAVEHEDEGENRLRHGRRGLEEDEDAEDRLDSWEKQQISKAVAFMPVTQGSAVLEAVTAPVKSRPFVAMDGNFSLNPGDVTLSNIKQALLERKSELETANRAHRADLEATVEDVRDCEDVVAECEKEMPVLEERFLFYQEMEAYFGDLVECFDEKMPRIEYLERRVVDVYRERWERLRERSRMDVCDEVDAVSTAAASGSRIAPTTVDPESKEAQMKRARVAEREARRMRRRRAQENQSNLPEGYSTDEEEPQSLVVKRQTELAAVGVDSQDLLADVLDDFSDLNVLLKQCQRWRHSQPVAYLNAFISACIPRLVSPLVRAQLILWNPLQSECECLQSQAWFRTLLLHSHSALSEARTGDATSPLTLGAKEDCKVLPLVVERILLHKVKDFISAAWNPLSGRESQRLHDLLATWVRDFPTLRCQSSAMRHMMTTVVQRFQESLEKDVFIPIYAKSVLENKMGAPHCFLKRRVWSALKLFGNLCIWQDLIEARALQFLALHSLLNRYILTGLNQLLETAEPRDLLAMLLTVVEHITGMHSTTKGTNASSTPWWHPVSTEKTTEEETKATGGAVTVEALRRVRPLVNWVHFLNRCSQVLGVRENAVVLIRAWLLELGESTEGLAGS